MLPMLVVKSFGHGQTSPFNLGAGRGWVNTRPEQFSQTPGRMILFGGQGLCLGLDGSAVCSSKRSRQTLKQPTCPKIKPCKASSSFPSLLLILSFKVTAEGGLVPSQLESVTLFSPPWAVSQLCWESLEQWAWAREVVILFCASAPPFDLAYLASECQLLQKLKKCLLLWRLPFPWCHEATPSAGPSACNVIQTTYSDEVLVEAVLSLQSLSATRPPPHPPWQESFPQRSWKVEMKHTRFLEFSIPISRSFSQFLALDLQSFMRHIFILSMR